MKEITKEERTVLEQNIENQIWFDFVKRMYPTAIYKIINNVELYPDRKTIVDATSYIRFMDFEQTVGKSAVKNIKSFLEVDENLGVLDIKDLSDEELVKLNMVMSMFPYQNIAKDEDFDLSELLITILNELREKLSK